MIVSRNLAVLFRIIFGVVFVYKSSAYDTETFSNSNARIDFETKERFTSANDSFDKYHLNLILSRDIPLFRRTTVHLRKFDRLYVENTDKSQRLIPNHQRSRNDFFIRSQPEKRTISRDPFRYRRSQCVRSNFPSYFVSDLKNDQCTTHLKSRVRRRNIQRISNDRNISVINENFLEQDIRRYHLINNKLTSFRNRNRNFESRCSTSKVPSTNSVETRFRHIESFPNLRNFSQRIMNSLYFFEPTFFRDTRRRININSKLSGAFRSLKSIHAKYLSHFASILCFKTDSLEKFVVTLVSGLLIYDVLSKDKPIEKKASDNLFKKILYFARRIVLY